MPKSWEELMLRWNGCDICGNISLGWVLRSVIWDRLFNSLHSLALCNHCMERHIGRSVHNEEIRWDLPWNRLRKEFYDRT